MVFCLGKFVFGFAWWTSWLLVISWSHVKLCVHLITCGRTRLAPRNCNPCQQVFQPWDLIFNLCVWSQYARRSSYSYQIWWPTLHSLSYCVENWTQPEPNAVPSVHSVGIGYLTLTYLQGKAFIA